MLTLFHPELGEALKDEQLIYVDSHICINDPKYIAFDTYGTPRLTDYARYHMDECCLVFELTINPSANAYQREYFLECVLCRDACEDIIFEARFNSSKGNLTIQEQAKLIKNRNRELYALRDRLPNSFPDAVVELMKWREVTVEGLAESAMTSTKTLQRIRNSPNYGTTLETVIIICIGLKLPHVLSFDLIKKAGYVLQNSELHLAYRHLLEVYYHRSLYECNELLEELGFPPLGDIC